MSKRVIFTCTVLLLLGLCGGYDIASSFAQGRIQFNLFVLFFPVSIALFLAVPGSRLAATIVFSILYLFLALVLVGASMARVVFLRLDLPMLDASSMLILVVLIFACVLALLHWMLFSPPFDEHLGVS
jgi:hypothetical protein